MLGWSPWKACSFLNEQWIWRWVGGVRRRRENFSRDVLYERIINKKVKRKYLIFTALRSCKERFIISNLSLTEGGIKEKKLKQLFSFFIYLFIICTSVLSACRYMYHMHVVHTKVRRGHQSPWNWTNSWLRGIMYMLGMEPRSSGRAAMLLIAEPPLQPDLVVISEESF